MFKTRKQQDREQWQDECDALAKATRVRFTRDRRGKQRKPAQNDITPLLGFLSTRKR